AMKVHAESTPGLGRVAVTSTSRIVAYSAPIGAWADDGANVRRRSGGSDKRESATEAGKSNRPEPSAGADESLSAYTRRLVQLLDDDMDRRSLEQPGLSVSALFLKASDPGSSQPGSAGEIMIENV